MSRVCCSRGATARRRPPRPLMDAVYDELRRLARGYLAARAPRPFAARDRAGPRGLLKLVDQRRVRWQNRAHFFAVASSVMRRLLVDHARARGAVEAGSGADGVARRRRRPADWQDAGSPRARRSTGEARPARPSPGAPGGAAVLRRADDRRSRRRPGRRGDHGEAGLGDGPDLAVPRARADRHDRTADWERVGELFHAAVDVAPEARLAFVKATGRRSAGPRGGRVAAAGATRRRRAS